MKVRITPRARSHVRGRQAWWAQHRPAAVSLFDEELEQALHLFPLHLDVKAPGSSGVFVSAVAWRSSLFRPGPKTAFCRAIRRARAHRRPHAASMEVEDLVGGKA